MRKTYRYRDLDFPVDDATEVKLTVEFLSDGGIAETLIYRSIGNNPKISDSGTELIGTGAELRGKITICITEATNSNLNEDEIRVRYLLNDTLMVEHHNLKSEEINPTIILFLKFPMP
ncbi:hypothetical protein [Cochleicola gelatinilyticus]|uniref:Uncharacterized protein n=1 Tax=Cochleicola gelatinilyticus TaxID=1763537 RepID=A0A167IE42_9FLAO|nr:hypothetical protein [Cochleicola gelatinilyticus]OAB79564.1 hypothetical protein ULVI_02080 [Cochleicola gelatinilyticus]